MWKLVPCGVWHVLLHLIIVIQDSCTSRRHSFYSSQHHVHKMQVRYVCGRYQAKWKCRGPFQSIKNSLQLTESWDSCFQCSLALKTTKGNELQKQMLQIRDCAVTFTNKRSCIIKHICFFIGPKYILLNLMFTFFFLSLILLNVLMNWLWTYQSVKVPHVVPSNFDPWFICYLWRLELRSIGQFLIVVQNSKWGWFDKWIQNVANDMSYY